MWLYGFLAKAPAISDDKRTLPGDNHVGEFVAVKAFQPSVRSVRIGDPFIAGKVSVSATGNWW